ncbi:hypothetical protein D8674_032105 [Pyrus ussuriensis x Pyrus communis]|uniref:KIB1-4 beta-propeller domain-containing protein n=1 Tax=Pyrus ussuriensis x Pyrus communis TaxID=2448454 RepID=A0A5N5F118_9ROSA|nr:hypothetical protein D8674_032105 [Pyrus ussuriensis x Pyrus communis]
MASDWANLPTHLLGSVLENLVSRLDYIRFSVVCMPWHCVAKDNKRKFDEMSSCHKGSTAWFFKGWLIVVNIDLVVTYKSVFKVKGRQKRADSIIDLPPLACPDNMSPRRKTIFVNKATLSADPILEADKCIVMVIHERERTDVVHVGNKFYVVKEMGTLFSFDITSDQSISDKQLVAADTLECFQKSVKTYVVVLDDNELLMVQRVVEFDDGGRWTNEVRIFKLNFDMYKWIETETLGHVALFLDDNFSISVKASNFSGCLPNCIYFNYNFDCVNSYPKHRLHDDYDVHDSGTPLKLCFILLYVASNVSFTDKNRGVLSSKNYNFIKH